MLDLYQLHGVSFALEEVDIDRVSRFSTGPLHR